MGILVPLWCWRGWSGEGGGQGEQGWRGGWGIFRRGGWSEIEMPEWWFCWFDNYSTRVNTGVSIFCVCKSVCVCVYTCLRLHFWVSEYVWTWWRGSERDREACEDKARGCVCLFLSGFAQKTPKQNETVLVSWFFFFSKFIWMFFFQHMKTDVNSTDT